MFWGCVDSIILYFPPSLRAFHIPFSFYFYFSNKNIGNMHGDSTSQIADILYFNKKQ